MNRAVEGQLSQVPTLKFNLDFSFEFRHSIMMEEWSPI
jgi:hypothetical protein